MAQGALCVESGLICSCSPGDTAPKPTILMPAFDKTRLCVFDSMINRLLSCGKSFLNSSSGVSSVRGGRERGKERAQY